MYKICELAFEQIIANKKFSMNEKIEMLQICLENGVDINQNKSIALKIAIESVDGELNNDTLITTIKPENLKIINFLIDSKIDIRANDNIALITACGRGYYEIVKLLLELGIDACAKNNEAMKESCQDYRYLDLRIIKLLIEYGADPCSHSNILLHKACCDGEFEIVKYVISFGVDFTKSDKNPINSSLDTYWYPEMIKLLLDNGANPNMLNNKICPLERCIMYRYFDGCKMLLEYGVNINSCHNIINKTEVLRNQFLKMSRNRIIKIVDEQKIIDLFMEHGLDVNLTLVECKQIIQCSDNNSENESESE